jgi:hypothetical protein
MAPTGKTDFDPVLPHLLTLTPKPTCPNVPLDKPPDTCTSALFPESTQYRTPETPYRGNHTINKLDEKYSQALQDAMDGMSSPFRYTPDSPFEFNGAAVGSDITAEDFNSAAVVVVAALERGYYLMRDATPLSTNDWARLACTMLTAIGCGYYQQHSLGQESALEEIRAQALDPSPLTPKFPTLFHRMVATADHLEMQTGTDQDNYQDWILTAKMECMEKATKAATTVAEEQWHLWKANQIEG